MNEKGLSLTELIISSSVLGALATISIPHAQALIARSYDIRVMSDVRSIVWAEELQFVDSGKYLSCRNAECRRLPGVAKLSKGIHVEVEATEESFYIRAWHPQGAAEVIEWDSARGGFLDVPEGSGEDKENLLQDY